MPSVLHSKNTALLVVDMQNGFCHPDSQMGKNVGVRAQERIIPAITRLVTFCREQGVPVIWSQQIHFPDDVTRERKNLSTHFKKQKFLPCLQGTFETELHPQIKPLVATDDQIISKHRASVFFDTNLNTRLRMLGVSHLLVAGCNTEFCVAHTVRDAYARDYELLILRDCVAGIKEEYHQLCLQMFADYFAEVISSDKLSDYFVK